MVKQESREVNSQIPFFFSHILYASSWAENGKNVPVNSQKALFFSLNLRAVSRLYLLGWEMVKMYQLIK